MSDPEPTSVCLADDGAPTTPRPDGKDWTWAIIDPCPDCGFDPRPVTNEQVPALTRRYAGAVRAALLRPDAAVRTVTDVWSTLEYGCHVRDVCLLFDQRLRLMLTEHDPQFDNWDQDETALRSRYWTQDPVAVAAQLAAAADSIGAAFAAVDGDQWRRPGRRSNGSVFTVGTFARYFCHDLAHHAWDVTT